MQTIDVQAYVEQLRKGTSIQATEPKDVAYYPAYVIDSGYRELMDRWNLDFEKTGYGATTQLSTEKGKNSSLKEAGHDTKEVEASLFWGWFTYKTTTSEKFEKVVTDEETTSVTVTMQAKQTTLVGIHPNNAPAGW